MRAVAYAKRMSVIPRYNDFSIKEQNDRIRAFAKKMGWELVGFYDDRSLLADSNVGFERLQDDGVKRQFDVVIIDSIYRCGKNVSFARELLQNIFYPAGIHFVILEDDINSFDMTAEEVSNYFFSVRQKANSVAGKDRISMNLAASGELSTDKECYGYLLSWDHKELVIDEEAAKVIRTIFEMYSDGYRTGEICSYLNEKEIDIPAVHLHKVAVSKPVCNSNTWTKSQLSSIRKKVRYTGTEEDLGYRKISYPPIISKELFDKVNVQHKGKPHGENAHKKSDFENAFFRKVYLGTDGQRLECGIYKRFGRHYFRKKNTCKGLVSYAEVEAKVREAIISEKHQCEQMLGILESDGGSNFIDTVRDVFGLKMKEVADDIDLLIVKKLSLYKGHESGELSDDEYDKAVDEINKRIESLNDSFDTLLSDADGKIESLSEDNPWIKRYLKIDEEMSITLKNMKDIVERIVIADGGDKGYEIEVYLNTEGKSKLPVCWRCADG